MGIMGASKQGALLNAAMHTFLVHNDGVAQRDLPRITSTFQAIKLLESSIIISVVGGNWETRSR